LAIAKLKICTKFIGCERFIDKFIAKLDIFSSSIYPPSKGILLYGPPGTGKSAISYAFCCESGFRFVCTPMAAGELKKGIVGDS
jgi:SpoVK/Ycf46/Vps4 family AAA+-type ATPase